MDKQLKRSVVKCWISDAVIKFIQNNENFKMDDEYKKILNEVMNDFHKKL